MDYLRSDKIDKIGEETKNKEVRHVTEKEILGIFHKHQIYYGRIVALSKSRYEEKNKYDKIMYNARIIHKKYGIVWKGDLNITQELEILKNIKNEINDPLYIIEEHLCFHYEWNRKTENGPNTIDELIQSAQYSLI